MVWANSDQWAIFLVIPNMHGELMAFGCGKYAIQGQYACKERSRNVSKFIAISHVDQKDSNESK
jgi:hypothetical protein